MWSEADNLLGLFGRAGFRRVETAVLQPARLFVDLSGEDIRRRLFATSDAEGREWCLRPEFTIPVARDHLASPEAGKRTDLAYFGPVFRQRPGESGEFLQAGAESFGRDDVEAADVDCLALALEACAAMGLAEPAIRIGDAGIFAALIDRLGLAEAAGRRLRRAYAAGRLDAVIGAMLAPAESGVDRHAGLLAAMAGQDPKAARAFVEDVLKIAGIEQMGGRRPGDIADRFLRRAQERGFAPLSTEAAETLRRFTGISGDPDQAAQAIRDLAAERQLDLAEAMDRFDERTGFLAARGVEPEKLAFSAAFARNLDYYSGFVFELHDPARRDGKPVAGGGRYDGLLTALGAKAPVRAVGFSMWVERFAGGRP